MTRHCRTWILSALVTVAAVVVLLQILPSSTPPKPATPVSTSPTPAPTPTPPSACVPKDYVMPCALRSEKSATQQQLIAAARRGLTAATQKQLTGEVRRQITASLGAVAQGFDFAWTAPSVASVKANGKVFAVGYYSYDPSKNWTSSQARTYRAAGVSTVGVFESSQFRPLQGCAAGTQDAQAAKRQEAAVGMAGAPVYAAVDFQTDGQESRIRPYFVCWQRGMGDLAGAYGGLATIRYLFNEHLIKWGWQTYAWSGGRWDPRAQLEQYLNDIHIGGIDVDLDRAIVSDYGQVPRPSGPSTIMDTTVRTFHVGSSTVKASEDGTWTTWNKAHCLNPVKRNVCKSSRYHDALLRDRLFSVVQNLHHGSYRWDHARTRFYRLSLVQKQTRR